MFPGKVCVRLKMFYSTRRPDMDESIVLDALQAKFTGKGKNRVCTRQGVYLNDRQVWVRHVYRGQDADNPRVEVWVWPVRGQDGGR